VIAAAQRIPTKVEPYGALAARYPAALNPIIDHRGVNGPVNLPAHHFFDAPNGVRLMISRERGIAGELWVHMSASIHAGEGGPALLEELKFHAADAPVFFCRLALNTWRKIAGRFPSEPRFLGLSDGKGVPHWLARIPS
jgi:hypothetical protein